METQKPTLQFTFSTLQVLVTHISVEGNKRTASRLSKRAHAPVSLSEGAVRRVCHGTRLPGLKAWAVTTCRTLVFPSLCSLWALFSMKGCKFSQSTSIISDSSIEGGKYDCAVCRNLRPRERNAFLNSDVRCFPEGVNVQLCACVCFNGTSRHVVLKCRQRYWVLILHVNIKIMLSNLSFVGGKG